jgi:hypothetical protein
MTDLSPTLFSVATSSLAPSPPWNYRMLTDPAAAAAFRSLGLKACRVNGLVMLTDIFGDQLLGQPNWGMIESLVVGYPQALPGARLTLATLAHWSINYADPNMRQRAADRIVEVAKYMKFRGLHVDRWEVINEPDFTPGPGDTADTERRTRNALHAAGFPEPVGGPCTSWNRSEYMDASIAAGAQFMDWHTYVKGPGDDVSTDELFNRANAVGGGGHGPHPWVLTEYGIDSWTKPGTTPDPRQQTLEGAIFAALCGISCANKGMETTYIWRLENDDGSYGVFHTNTWNLNPTGALIQAANKYLIPGTIKPFSTGTATRTIALLSDGGSKGQSLLLVNYNIGGNPASVAVPAGFSLRWQQNRTNDHGLASNTPTSLVNLPPLGVAILSTTSQAPSKPDDADGTKVGPGQPLQANGHKWFINPAAVIEVDDVPDTTTANVVSLQSIRPLVVQTNAAGGQWSKKQPSDQWATYTGPTPVPPNPTPEPPTDEVTTKAAQWDALVKAMTPLVQDILDTLQ